MQNAAHLYNGIGMLVLYQVVNKRLEYANSDQFDLIIVDAVSLRTSGERICRTVKKVFPEFTNDTYPTQDEYRTRKSCRHYTLSTCIIP